MYLRPLPHGQGSLRPARGRNGSVGGGSTVVVLLEVDGVGQVEVGQFFVGNREPHFQAAVGEERLADGFEGRRTENRRVPAEKGCQRESAGRSDLEVALDERSHNAIRIAALHQRVGVRAVHPPSVLHRLLPHRPRQFGGGFERER